jgi:hypothetical protein
MAFDLARVVRELDAAPPSAELPWEVGVAVVSDTLRRAGLAPPTAGVWNGWRKKWPRAAELVPELARALVASSLGDETVRTLADARGVPKRAFEDFFESVAPLTREMVRTNHFRREEFLRYWIERCGGSLAGETAEASRARLAQLDYRQALSEYKKAESARKTEAARRAQLLREAKEREEQAKGWRE